jgi:diguanylate cyclase (GGDEF)-like protein/PAS domain S-box-containing protein
MAADRLNLLIIEDSADDAELLLWQLRKSGYTLSWERVETPEKMLVALARQEWDLIISDYAMPRFSGIEAINLLKQQKFDIPFIMISGNAGEDTVVAALQAGADHYLPKSQLSRLAPVIDRELAAAAERRQQRQAERERTLLRQAMEAIPLGVTIADTEGRIIYTNSAGAEMHGYEVAALIGEDVRTLEPKECWSQDGNGFTDCSVSIREGVNVRSDGTTFPVQITAAKVFDARGDQLGVATITEDITERKRSDERLRYMRSHDGLTGLHNRIYFEEELKRLSRSRLFPISFILFDVDGLKKINELKGHGHGDLVLQEAARILAKLFRAEDMIARIGGDEFIAMLPQTSYLAAENKVERIREALEKERSKQGAVNVSLSLGVATSFEAGTLADAIRLADARMYSDKVSRRPLPPWTVQKPRSIFHPSCLLLDFHPET